MEPLQGKQSEEDACRRAFREMVHKKEQKRQHSSADDDFVSPRQLGQPVHATELKLSKRPHCEEPASLSPEQLEQMEQRKREAKQRRRERLLMQPAVGVGRPGANGGSYAYQTIDTVVEKLIEAFGPLGFSVHPMGEAECSSRQTTTGSEMVQHVCFQKMRLTIYDEGREVIYEATGSSVQTQGIDAQFTSLANARKAAESDGLKRCARFLGPWFKSVPDASPGPAQ
jgi:hypothetical protein